MHVCEWNKEMKQNDMRINNNHSFKINGQIQLTEDAVVGVLCISLGASSNAIMHKVAVQHRGSTFKTQIFSSQQFDMLFVNYVIPPNTVLTVF